MTVNIEFDSSITIYGEVYSIELSLIKLLSVGGFSRVLVL